jgi:hypothetical protein
MVSFYLILMLGSNLTAVPEPFLGPVACKEAGEAWKVAAAKSNQPHYVCVKVEARQE